MNIQTSAKRCTPAATIHYARISIRILVYGLALIGAGAILNTIRTGSFSSQLQDVPRLLPRRRMDIAFRDSHFGKSLLRQVELDDAAHMSASTTADCEPHDSGCIANTADAGAQPQPSPDPTRIPRPPRDPSFVEEQRVIAGERDVTSNVFEELTTHSMNPPAATADAELSRRLVVAIALGVHSGNTNVPEEGLQSLPLFNVLISTFLPTAQPHHHYRFYLAFDHNDPIYESAEWRDKIEQEFQKLVLEEDSKRWHPPGYSPPMWRKTEAGTVEVRRTDEAGSPIDGTRSIDESSLVITLHWVHCDYSGKPSWAHNDAVTAAYREGADYVFRTNDDSACPTVLDWVDRLIIDLRQREIPNLGVVGPACQAGAHYILTHDFTHKTHVTIFGFHYPRSLPNWSSDDWITYVYQQFGLMVKREDVPVKHMLHGKRYAASPGSERLPLLNKEISDGAHVIVAWGRAHHEKDLKFTPKTITCC